MVLVVLRMLLVVSGMILVISNLWCHWVGLDGSMRVLSMSGERGEVRAKISEQIRSLPPIKADVEPTSHCHMIDVVS